MDSAPAVVSPITVRWPLREIDRLVIARAAGASKAELKALTRESSPSVLKQSEVVRSFHQPSEKECEVMKSKGVVVLVKKMKETVAEAKRNRQELVELYKQLLSDDYRRMQVETIRWLVKVWGEDPEDFAMMYEEHLDEDGSIVPELEVIQEFHPELPFGLDRVNGGLTLLVTK